MRIALRQRAVVKHMSSLILASHPHSIWSRGCRVMRCTRVAISPVQQPNDESHTIPARRCIRQTILVRADINIKKPDLHSSVLHDCRRPANVLNASITIGTLFMDVSLLSPDVSRFADASDVISSRVHDLENLKPSRRDMNDR
jgi:hypothetical protein